MQLFARTLRYSGIAVLLAVLAIGPFYQGLFFWTELLAAIAALAAGFTLWLIGRHLADLPSGLPGGWPGILLLALLGCYLLQFFWAVFPRGNLDWVLRVTAAWFAYVMVRAEAGPSLRQWLGWTVVLSAAAVGFVGFLEFTGYTVANPEIGQALTLFGMQNRMFTTFQYPNTAAVYFLAALFVAMGLGLQPQRPWRLALAGGLISFLGLSFFFTISRGGVVVLPFGLLLLFLGLDRDKRWPALLLLLAGIVPMIAALKGIGANAEIQNWVSAFRWLGAATVGGAVGGLVLSLFLRLKLRQQFVLAGVAVALLVVLGLLVRPEGGLLPKQAARLLDMNFRTGNVVLRLTYMEDALQIVRDRPMGQGGWGWTRLYPQYQDFNYSARETHNHFAQTAVDAGIPGLLALLGGLGMALWGVWRNRQGQALGWSLSAGAGLILAHSLIDFNLSYGVVWLLCWGMLAAGDAPTQALRVRLTKPIHWAGITGGAAVMLLSLLLLAGAVQLKEAKVLAAAGQKEEAALAAHRAVRYDRWNSEGLLLIGDLPALERAVKIDRANATAQRDLAQQLELEKDLAGALPHALAAVEAAPLISARYTKAASLAGMLMVDAIRVKDHKRAQELGVIISSLGEKLIARQERAKARQHLWPAPPLVMEPVFRLRYGQALYLAGDEAGAEPHLKAAGDVGLLGSEAHVWLYAIYERRNDTVALAELEAKPWIRFRNANPVYQQIKAWQ